LQIKILIKVKLFLNFTEIFILLNKYQSLTIKSKTTTSK